MNLMDMWYFELDIGTIISSAKNKIGKDIVETAERKARKQVASHVFPKITEEVEGHRRIIDEPPLIYHSADRRAWPEVGRLLSHYWISLPFERRALFDHYHFEDFALKVVGVGSVGTRCGLALMLAEPNDPLFLQVKEAVPSVLEPYAGKSEFIHQGQRVVVGQRMIQTNGDIMLGWLTVDGS